MAASRLNRGFQCLGCSWPPSVGLAAITVVAERAARAFDKPVGLRATSSERTNRGDLLKAFGHMHCNSFFHHCVGVGRWAS